MTRRQLKPEDRLIVAADFEPDPKDGVTNIERVQSVRRQVLELCESLRGTNVYIKVNTALRACGYGLIAEIHQMGLRVFADLKLCDIGNTLKTEGVLLEPFRPELLTVMCVTGEKAMKALKAKLPDTEILGVTILTDLTEDEVLRTYNGSIEDVVLLLAGMVHLAGIIDGLVCSAKEAGVARHLVRDDLTINTPAVRPAWAVVAGEDQNPERIMTPAKAIMAGADRIVVGRPITQASNPREAVERTLEELASVVLA